MSTPTDYPLPKSAAYIWTNGDKIFLTFPGYEGSESRRFNTVTLDPSDHPKCKCGCIVRSHVLTTMFEVLKARSNTDKGPSAQRKIGNLPTPTQAQLDEALARQKRTKARSAEDKATAAVDKLGPEKALALLKQLGFTV